MPVRGAGKARAIALRTRLLAAMLGPLLGAATIIGIGGATLISDVVRRTNDRVLGGALGAIAETVQVERGEVTLDLPPAAFGMLENSERDNVYYRIAVGAELLTGYADLPAPDPATMSVDQPRFRFARYRDQGIRIAEVKRMLPRIERPVIIQVAETLDNRKTLAGQLTIALLLGEVALVGVAVLLLRPALGWSLRPLARLRRSVEARDSSARPDFSPLDAGPLPNELRPLATAFDHLLAQLDKATGGVRRFTADASHQMRTPLSVLKVQVELARRGSSAALDEIADAVQRLERLVTQLLALARAEEGGVSPPLEAVDLKEVSSAVISRLINQAIQADVELNLDADERRYLVQAHRTLVFEIVANLIDNGIRYNRRGGAVTVSLSHDAGRISLTVSDDGPGIAPEFHDKVFERFFRATGPHGAEGTGLGLAIVQSAASRMGARVMIASPGPGTRITVIFAADSQQ
ncbi:sensor histidine kinase N-terminal domain-containing protein [Sphingobium sp. CR2-8]|uniref:sensor histidine kinase n=1 Tax=Sphingobium sp. CR2-8 TaxID=1306534 RepID=UPI002DBA186C|nr:sensor histidine kinase N-terminal domain-containing protein [Sphingobium sp. CR2-8]MEC3910011.1 sensor histidine kinase N-terminal domain-containing protein [Sphingobium sp. CR2-8]